MAAKDYPFYNLDRAVGPGCPNTPTDVMLVQFFLHQIYTHPGKASSKPAGPKIEINGRFDGTTAEWIKHFQAEGKAKGKAMGSDGRVSPAQGDHFAVSAAGNFYMITYLNYNHCARYRQAHNHLEQHPLIPPALKAELVKGEPKPM
jgi:hypothetical protein